MNCNLNSLNKLTVDIFLSWLMYSFFSNVGLHLQCKKTCLSNWLIWEHWNVMHWGHFNFGVKFSHLFPSGKDKTFVFFWENHQLCEYLPQVLGKLLPWFNRILHDVWKLIDSSVVFVVCSQMIILPFKTVGMACSNRDVEQFQSKIGFSNQ